MTDAAEFGKVHERVDGLEKKFTKMEGEFVVLSASVDGVKTTVDSTNVMLREMRTEAAQRDKVAMEAAEKRAEAEIAEAKSRAPGMKEFLGWIGGAVVVVSAMLTGNIYLIDSRVATSASSSTAQISQVSAAVAQNSATTTGNFAQMGDRFSSVLDSLRNARDEATIQAKEIANLGIEIGRHEDRIQENTRRWQAWEAHDWQGRNATQDAEIEANRNSLVRIDRDLDRLSQKVGK